MKKFRPISKVLSFFLISLLFLSEFSFLQKHVYAGESTYSTGSGTFSVPAGTTTLIIETWGGGGGAGAPDGSNNGVGGGGGGGGGYGKKTITSSSINSSYSYSVGSGGAVGTGGGDSTVDTTFVVGNGGTSGTAGSGGTPGTAGSGGSGTGDTVYTGGNGADGTSSSGGGGGGGAGSSSNGTGATGTTGGAGGTGNTDGTGGTGGSGNNSSGIVGSAWGGGGGAGTGRNGASAAGASGYIRFTYYAPPTVSTQSATNVGSDSATGNGNITDTGDKTVTERGFAYMEGSTGDPTIASSTVSSTGTFTTGSYTEQLTGLSSSTDYRVRAFAINEEGTSYGTTVGFTTTGVGETMSGIIYQTDETTPYDCSANNLTVSLRINGSGTDTATCTTSSGSWSIGSLSISSGQTVYVYIDGETQKGSTVLVTDGTGQNNVHILQDRVTLRDDVNGSITNTEISNGDTADADDLISFSGSDITVGSSYETHIYTGDTYAPGSNVTTGKLHVVGTYSGSTETLTLTGSGTGTSRPLYVDGGTFTAPSTTVFQGSSDTSIDNQTYNALSFTPTITGATAYTFLGASSVNGNLTLNPTASTSQTLTTNLGGVLNVSGTTTLSGTTSGLSTLDTVSGSNFNFYSGNISIGAPGTLNANNSTITLTGTSGTLFTETGTFTAGGSNTHVNTDSSVTLFSGSPNFFDLTLSPINMANSRTYNIGSPFVVSGSFFTINPIATGNFNLTVNMEGNITTASHTTTRVDGVTGFSTLDTSSVSNYSLSTGRLNIQSGTVNAYDSNITLTGTTGNIFTNGGTFNEGTSLVTYSQTTGSTTLNSGAIDFYDLTINMSGQTGSAGGNIGVGNNLSVDAGTMSVGSTYTLNVTGATDITGDLSVAYSGLGALNFSGTTTINSGGTFSRSNGLDTTFTGLLTISEGGTFTTSNNPTFTLQGGILNSGTFTSGTGSFTFDTNEQSISGSANTTFGGNVDISGAITVQNNNTDTVTITGDLTGTQLGSTFINGANSTTNFKGAVLSTGTLTATASPNDIYYTGGSAQTVKPTTYHNLYIQPSANSVTSLIGLGTLTVNNNLTLGNGTNTGIIIDATLFDPDISVSNNLSVNANTTFTNSDSTSATLNIDGDLTFNGTFTAPVGTNNDSFTLAGDLLNNGTFNHNNGQITLDGTGTSALNYGSNTNFYNFYCATAGKAIQFDETYTTVIANDITLQGTNCTTGRIFLDSTTNDNAWDINIQTGATQDIDYIDLEDADGTSSDQTPIADNSTETGTNTSWTVNAGACEGGGPEPQTNFDAESIIFEGINID